jgi:phthiocerol/phenolphthiocerol synthesis type-I polyketide synthase B
MTDRRIAVVGIGCRYPGGVSDPDSFWQLLERGTDVIGEMPAGRFDVGKLFDSTPRTPGRVVTREGGFLEEIDRFDAAFFGISPREAQKIDPQQRLLLEVVWEALEDAGIVPSSLAGGRVGVYAGLWSGEYEQVLSRRLEEMDLYATTGTGRYAAAGRISFALDARGPSLTVDTACSSSLVALHLAAQSLRTGECDTAIVAAANLILQPFISVAYSRSGMLSPSARCRFGAPGPDGYVRSEGAGALVLRRLDEAVAAGDPVHAVVLGSAVNSDGRGSDRLVAPSLDAQMEMLRTAYADAGIDPGSVAYVEAHGTGTQAGDAVELSALGAVLGPGRAEPLAVGSVKRLIGHTEAASGLAGVIKAVLALGARRVPEGGNGRERNPEIPWSELNLHIPTGAVALPAAPDVRVGVNSFGVTGTNAHVVLSAAPAHPDLAAAELEQQLVPLSARTAAALDQRARALLDHLGGAPALSIADLSHTLTRRREHHEHRLALVSGSVAELAQQLRDHLAGEDSQTATGVADPAQAPRVAFVFSGQGSQWLGMGRELMRCAPAFAATIGRCDALIREQAGWSLLEVLEGTVAGALERVDLVQPTLACVQIALAEQLRAWGVAPAAVVGHSMGEVAAAHCAGALTLADAVRVIVGRSRLLARIAGAGAMALIDLPQDEVLPLLEPAGGRVSVAALNGPRSTVISGDPSFIDALVERLDDDGIFCRRVKVDVASHSVQTDPLLEPLRAELAVLDPRVAQAPFYSTARPGAPGDRLLDASYWVDNLRRPVGLLPAVRAMVADGIDTFIEIAPHPVLLTSLGDIAADADAAVRTLGVQRREEPELRRLLELVARLYAVGVPVDWSQLTPPGQVLRLPTYPWQRERHWLDVWEDWSGEERGGAASVPRPETASVVHEVAWQVATPADGASVSGTWLIVADRRGVAPATAAQLSGRGAEAVVVGGAAELEDAIDGLRARGGVPAGVLFLAGLDADASSPDDASPLRTGCGAALECVHALLRTRLAIPTWWATHSAQTLPARAGRREAWAQGALWGFVRTLWQEHPELDAHLVDVDGDAADCAEQLVLALGGFQAEPQLAFDAGVPHAARLVEAGADALATPLRLRADAAYLVTGGLGALGLVAAEELVRGGARRLVLMNRTPLPPRSEWARLEGPSAARVAGVLRLEALGASVHVAAVDVADAAALRAWLEGYRLEQWPAIRGVVHCAGQLDNHPVASLTTDGLLGLLRGKALAAYCLDALLPDVERTIYFSSTVAVLPQPGQANYAAANAALDALAAARSAAGLPTVSLGWGVWKGQGLVADERVGRYVATMEASGYRSLEAEQARPLLQWSAGSARAHLLLAPVDWSTARASLANRPGAPFYGELLGAATESEGSGLRALLAETTPAQRRGIMIEQLRAQVARVLGMATADIAPASPLGRQGLDSLMALEFRNRLERALELRLPASLAWNYPTLEVLADHLLERLALGAGEPDGRLESVAAPVAAAAAPQGVGLGAARASVAELSDDDVLRELMGGL